MNEALYHEYDVMVDEDGRTITSTTLPQQWPITLSVHEFYSEAKIAEGMRDFGRLAHRVCLVEGEQRWAIVGCPGELEERVFGD